MKNIKYIFSFVLLFIGYTTYAQTEDEIAEMQQNMNIPALKQIGENARQNYEIRKNQLELYIQQFGWQPTYTTPDGDVGVLTDYDDNTLTPIYSFALDATGNQMIKANSLFLGGSLGLNIQGQGFVGGNWELFNGSGAYYPNTQHIAFMQGNLSRLSVGYDNPMPLNISQTNNHSSRVCASMIGGGTLYPGSVPQASCRSYSYDNDAYEMQQEVTLNGLLTANHSHTSYDALYGDQILFNAPYLFNVLSNGNGNNYSFANMIPTSINFNAYYSRNSISVGRCFVENNYNNPMSIRGYGDGALKTNNTTVNISDNTVINAPITYSSNENVDYYTNIQLKINITHPKPTDLGIYLVGPNNCGTLEISTGNGGNGQNYSDAYFNANAIENITTALAPFSNKYYKTEGTIYQAPTNLSSTIYASLPSSPINGCPVGGTWKLYVGDNVSGNTGTLNNWSLVITNSVVIPNKNVIKPDIVAKSEDVITPGASSNTIYNNYSGTSFASPTVAGVGILLQQLYKDYNPTFMRSSTVRALMNHTAKEAGYPGPDIKFGYGILDAEKAAKVIINEGLTSSIQENELINGDTYSYDVVASFNKPLTATIAWLDPFNTISWTTLTNDLDLRIISANGTELPWALDSDNPLGPTLKMDNFRDACEKIQIDNPLGGQTYTIQVTNKGSLVGGSQKYSLIISGIGVCDANDPVDLTMSNPIDANKYSYEHASNSITASNVLNATSMVKYVAGNEVLMTDGFDGLLNSTYDALIGDCVAASLNKTNRYNPINREVILFDNKGKQVLQNEKVKPIISPNPSNGIFNINTNGVGTKGEYEVLDNNGLLITKGNITDTNFKIDLSKYANGFYYMHIKTEKGIYTNKLTLIK